MRIEGDRVASADRLVEERRCAVYVALRAVTGHRENGARAIDNDAQPEVAAVEHEHVVCDWVNRHQRRPVQHGIRAGPVGEPSSAVSNEGGDNAGRCRHAAHTVVACVGYIKVA